MPLGRVTLVGGGPWRRRPRRLPRRGCPPWSRRVAPGGGRARPRRCRPRRRPPLPSPAAMAKCGGGRGFRGSSGKGGGGDSAEGRGRWSRQSLVLPGRGGVPTAYWYSSRSRETVLFVGGCRCTVLGTLCICICTSGEGVRPRWSWAFALMPHPLDDRAVVSLCVACSHPRTGAATAVLPLCLARGGSGAHACGGGSTQPRAPARGAAAAQPRVQSNSDRLASRGQSPREQPPSRKPHACTVDGGER